MNRKNTNTKLVALFVLFVMLCLSCSVTVRGTASGNECLSKDIVYEKMMITVHTLHGKRNIQVEVPVEEVQSERIPSFEEILSYLPTDEATRITQQFEQDKQTLSTQMQEHVSTLNIIEGRLKNTALGRMLADREYFVNYLCSVKGVGLLFLFPPFLPITPILWAGLLIINTNGMNGEINEGVEQAIMMPFIGLSAWWVQMYVFAGFAGVAIGITQPDNTSL